MTGKPHPPDDLPEPIELDAVSADSASSGSRANNQASGKESGDSEAGEPPAGAPEACVPDESVTWLTRGKRRKPVKRLVLTPEFWALMGCNFVVFVGSLCIMVLELTAARLVAKHVGQSLYTWTSVIGVVLAGITAGNYIGGWLADRFENRQRTLAWLFFAASLLSGSVLVLDGVVGGFERGDLSWPTWVLWIVAFIIFAPAVALGTISPVAASIALSRSTKTGITVGSVYAWGALGSIVGTFLTGFWLIDLLGSRAVVGVTAMTLAVMGIAVASRQWVFRSAVLFGWLQFLAYTVVLTAVDADVTAKVGRTIGGMLGPKLSAYDHQRLAARGEKRLTPGQRRELLAEGRRERIGEWTQFGRQLGGDLHRLGLTLELREDDLHEYHDESNYSYIFVGEETTADGDVVKFLRLDTLEHSYYNPDNPTALYYEYEQVYAAVTERAARQWKHTTSVSLAECANRGELAGGFPERIRYDASRAEMSITGAMSQAERDELLAASPIGPYWQALEDLRRRSNRPDFGGWVWSELESLPEGADIPEDVQETFRYDPILHALNAYAPVSDALFERLIDSAPHAPFYRAVNSLYGKSRQVSTFFIGGGGFIFPRWIEAKFPDRPRIDVAELDPAVKRAVRATMGLPPDDQTAVHTIIGDARRVVDDRLRLNNRRGQQNKPPILYDFVYGDAFNDFSVPWHLTTREFSQKIRRLLHPRRGVYLVNIIDIYTRTEYPTGEEYRNGVRYTGKLPEPLRVEWSGISNLQQCPPPFTSLEVSEHKEGGEVMFGFRGRMSAEMRRRLIGLDPRNTRFAHVVEQLYRRTQDLREGRFLGRYVNTMIEVFPNVYVFSSSSGEIPGEERDTLVIVASMRPLELDDLRYGEESGEWSGQPFAWRETDPNTGKRTSGGQLDSVLALSDGLMLTDDFAPVDNLLIPVFLDRD